MQGPSINTISKTPDYLVGKESGQLVLVPVDAIDSGGSGAGTRSVAITDAGGGGGGGGSGGTGVPIGTVIRLPSNVAPPDGFLPCDGRLVLKTDWPEYPGQDALVVVLAQDAPENNVITFGFNPFGMNVWLHGEWRGYDEAFLLIHDDTITKTVVYEDLSGAASGFYSMLLEYGIMFRNRYGWTTLASRNINGSGPVEILYTTSAQWQTTTFRYKTR